MSQAAQQPHPLPVHTMATRPKKRPADPGIHRPTHWADDRGYVVTDEWLQSPQAASDWRAAYHIPGRMVRGKFKPLAA